MRKFSEWGKQMHKKVELICAKDDKKRQDPTDVVGEIRTQYGTCTAMVANCLERERVIVWHNFDRDRDGWDWIPGPGIDGEILEMFWEPDEFPEVEKADMGGGYRHYWRIKK